MSVGERGGTAATLEEGVRLIAMFKGDLATAVRVDILDHLESASTWHRDDLRVILPPQSKNVLGAVVNGLVRSGRIVETGERRPSAEPAAHGRRSAVYRLSQVSGGDPERVGRDTVSLDGPAVSAPPNASHPAKEGVDTPAELTGGRDGAGEDAKRVTSHSGLASPALSLFELEPDRGSYYDREAA